MQVQNITREQVVELAQTMPLVKLIRWYEYGLFIQTSPLTVAAQQPLSEADALQQEFAASDEDWSKFEELLAEME
jgi:hypothetical protein